MSMISIAAGLALLAAAAPGLAAPKKGQAGYDPDRLICKSKAVVGSRVQRIRECHTALEWEELKFQESNGLMRQQINGMQSQSSQETYLPPGRGADMPQ